MTKAIVVINEQHNLMEDQVRILNEEFDEYELLKVPAVGWTLPEINQVADDLAGKTAVIVSPVPALIKLLAMQADEDENIFVFHNDNREKKELPSGKIVMTVAAEGWVLV
jgi:hypothetical protein